jgi:hypothetical protein
LAQARMGRNSKMMSKYFSFTVCPVAVLKFWWR